MDPTSRIEIDLDTIAHNLAVVRTAAPDVAVCAVLKADGYALGSARLARRLAASGIDMLAVYTPEQARTLLDLNIAAPILLLMPIRRLERDDRLYRAASLGGLHLTAHDASNLQAIVQIADTLGIALPVHLEIDTGMSRGGAPLRDASGLVARINEHPRLRLAGVFTHYASADSDPELTETQTRRFRDWLDAESPNIPEDCLIHQANTFATFREPSTHARMVRVGLALLGFAHEEFAEPDTFSLAHHARELQPCLRWASNIVHVKIIPSGTPVGYGATWTSQRPSRIGLVPVGYADGYPLALSSTPHYHPARVGIVIDSRIRAFAPVVGRVSMDQITIDLTDLPAEDVGVGTEVELISREKNAPNSLPTLANRADSISHELLCRLSPRIPRLYRSGESSVIPTGASARSSR